LTNSKLAFIVAQIPGKMLKRLVARRRCHAVAAQPPLARSARLCFREAVAGLTQQHEAR
jgi:hypothetical protein